MMEETWQNKLIVATIDFGTTYSGFALSFLDDYEKDKTRILTQYWHAADHLVTVKTPTVLLLKPNKTFHSFGYTAETKYAALAADDNEQEWRYFRRFKMELFSDRNRRGISVESKIKDTSGRDFNAIEVFAMSIKFMQDEIIKEVSKKFAIREEDIHYVLTVPAIWSDTAKYFMRKAAKKAGIPEERLRIALEPECAAAFVQTSQLPSIAAASKEISMLPGSCHIVVDLGGGTCDIAAHRVNAENKFEEIIPPEGGPWGADIINDKFERFLVSISGAPAFNTFKQEHMEDFLDLQRQFELKKKAFKDDEDEPNVTIRLPEAFRNLHKQRNSEDLSQSVRQMNIQDLVEFKNEKMRFNKSIFKGFFEETLKGVIQIVESVVKRVPDANTTLIFVGGFSDCILLQNAVKDRFKDKPILFPSEAVSAIMKGAIIYGRDESIVNIRISRFTYGIDWNEDFDEKAHPISKREETDDGYVCTDIFKKVISKGQRIKWNTPIEVIEAYPKSKYQTEMQFPFYRSEILESPKFVTDEGCVHMGTMTVSLGNHPVAVLDRFVKLFVYCGKTEIKTEAMDDKGKKYTMSFKYVETQI